MKRSFPARRSARRLRRALELGCALAFGLTVVLSGALARYDALCRRVCRDTLRLHILANSDTPEDQLLKFTVRDAMLRAITDLTADAASQPAAVSAVERALPYLQRTAEQAAGGCQPVQVSLETADFPAKDYGDFRLPAGRYTALRVELGQARGHNWFCVLYPALCVGAAGADYDDPDENALVFGEYQVRFALLDSLRALCG